MNKASVPSTWHEAPLEDVLDSIVGGGTPSKSNSSYYQGDIPWMTVKDMNRHVLNDTIDHISQEAVDNSSTNVIPAGIPIVATRMSLGKIVTAKFDSAINQDLKALYLNRHVDVQYLVHWYRSQSKVVEGLGTGTTVKGIRLEILKSLCFPLAPQKEQKEISERLDNLLAQIDSIKTRLDAIPAILKRFRQSVLAAAVSGRLTEGESSTRAYLSINKYMYVPASWHVTRLNDVSENVTSGSRGWAKYYSTSGSLFIRSQDINTDELVIKDAAYVSLPDKAEGKRTKIQMDDLLVTITGANVTKCARVKERYKDAYISQHVALIRPKASSESAFLELVLKAGNAGRQQLKEMAYGGGKPGLNLNNIRDVKFALPSEEEQTEIVRCVDQLFAFADQIETQVKNAQTRVNKLTQSILAKAFRGELTADWRAEHPELVSGENSAQALLERIKAEQAKLAPQKKGRKKRT